MAWTEPPRTWTDTELVTASIMNTHVRDQFKTTPHLLAYKSADESLNTNTTLQDDDHLFFSVAANEIWHIKLNLFFTDASAGTADIKLAFTWPASATGGFYTVFQNAGGTLAYRQWESSGSATDLSGDNATALVVIEGVLEVAGTSGTFRLQWAQNTSNASNVTVEKGSILTGLKLA